MSAIAFALSAALAAAPADPCDGATTPEIELCAAGRTEAADADLTRYRAAARAQVVEAAGDDGAGELLRGASAAFDEAELRWEAYREAACQAVYAYWSGGTIRGLQYQSCKLSLSRGHARELWSAWLTYPDGSPPVLPEPAASDEP